MMSNRLLESRSKNPKSNRTHFTVFYYNRWYWIVESPLHQHSLKLFHVGQVLYTILFMHLSVNGVPCVVTVDGVVQIHGSNKICE